MWADPDHGRYVKMITRAGVLTAFVCVGMPRTAAELTLLYDAGGELPADRSVLLRLDGPDATGGASADAFAPSTTVFDGNRSVPPFHPGLSCARVNSADVAYGAPV